MFCSSSSLTPSLYAPTCWQHCHVSIFQVKSSNSIVTCLDLFDCTYICIMLAVDFRTIRFLCLSYLAWEHILTMLRRMIRFLVGEAHNNLCLSHVAQNILLPFVWLVSVFIREIYNLVGSFKLNYGHL